MNHSTKITSLDIFTTPRHKQKDCSSFYYRKLNPILTKKLYQVIRDEDKLLISQNPSDSGSMLSFITKEGANQIRICIGSVNCLKIVKQRLLSVRNASVNMNSHIKTYVEAKMILYYHESDRVIFVFMFPSLKISRSIHFEELQAQITANFDVKTPKIILDMEYVNFLNCAAISCGSFVIYAIFKNAHNKIVQMAYDSCSNDNFYKIEHNDKLKTLLLIGIFSVVLIEFEDPDNYNITVLKHSKLKEKCKYFAWDPFMKLIFFRESLDSQAEDVFFLSYKTEDLKLLGVFYQICPLSATYSIERNSLVYSQPSFFGGREVREYKIDEDRLGDIDMETDLAEEGDLVAHVPEEYSQFSHVTFAFYKNTLFGEPIPLEFLKH